MEALAIPTAEANSSRSSKQLDMAVATDHRTILSRRTRATRVTNSLQITARQL